MKQIVLLLLSILSFATLSAKTQRHEATALDSTFFEFFETFIWNKTFQRSRVIFPIQLGDRKISKAEDWQEIIFHKPEEYFRTLNADTLSIFEKDVKQTATTMYLVDFKKKLAETFSFKKRNGNWYLTKAEEIPWDKLPDANFLKFLTKFSNDSLFQIKSIAFPLSNVYADVDNDFKILSKKIPQQDWKFWRITDDINGLMLLSDIDTANSYRNVLLRGVNNGIWWKYTFKKENEHWQLIKLEDFST